MPSVRRASEVGKTSCAKVEIRDVARALAIAAGLLALGTAGTLILL